jgi:hypothetical protein
LMFAGTLTRLAGAQLGRLVPRSSYERFMRLGGTLGGMVIAGFMPSPSDLWVMTLAAIPSALFGLWEAASLLLSTRGLSLSSVCVSGSDVTGNHYGYIASATKDLGSGESTEDAQIRARA